MILVAGPRMDQSDVDILPGIEIKGFIPDLYQHFAACDLAVVQGGFSSTLELTTLKRPFIYFPIEGHTEQEFVSKRLNRHQAGIRMNYSETTPEVWPQRFWPIWINLSNLKPSIQMELKMPPISSTGSSLRQGQVSLK